MDWVRVCEGEEDEKNKMVDGDRVLWRVVTKS